MADGEIILIFFRLDVPAPTPVTAPAVDATAAPAVAPPAATEAPVAAPPAETKEVKAPEAAAAPAPPATTAPATKKENPDGMSATSGPLDTPAFASH